MNTLHPDVPDAKDLLHALGAAAEAPAVAFAALVEELQAVIAIDAHRLAQRLSAHCAGTDLDIRTRNMLQRYRAHLERISVGEQPR